MPKIIFDRTNKKRVRVDRATMEALEGGTERYSYDRRAAVRWKAVGLKGILHYKGHLIQRSLRRNTTKEYSYSVMQPSTTPGMGQTIDGKRWEGPDRAPGEPAYYASLREAKRRIDELAK